MSEAGGMGWNSEYEWRVAHTTDNKLKAREARLRSSRFTIAAVGETVSALFRKFASSTMWNLISESCSKLPRSIYYII